MMIGWYWWWWWWGGGWGWGWGWDNEGKEEEEEEDGEDGNDNSYDDAIAAADVWRWLMSQCCWRCHVWNSFYGNGPAFAPDWHPSLFAAPGRSLIHPCGRRWDFKLRLLVIAPSPKKIWHRIDWLRLKRCLRIQHLQSHSWHRLMSLVFCCSDAAGRPRYLLDSNLELPKSSPTAEGSCTWPCWEAQGKTELWLWVINHHSPIVATGTGVIPQ